MDKPSFLSWHFGQAIPAFTARKLNQLTETLKFFNLAGLLKNLFAPYRRLVVTKKTPSFNVSTLFDRITFNLTSIFVGVSVRLILIFTGILAFIFMIFFNLLSILLYGAIPLFSFPTYLKINRNTFYQEDIQSPAKFLKKLENTRYFMVLRQFFDDGFTASLQKLPQPISVLSPKSNQSANWPTAEIIISLSKNLANLTKYLEQKNIKQKQFELLATYLKDNLENPPSLQAIPLGQMLTFGYTNTLDKFCSELTSQTLPPPAKKEALLLIEKVMTRPQNNNVLLVGEPGVGRHNLLLNLASSIQRRLLPSLDGKRVMLLDTIALAGTGENLIEVKSNFEAILEEAKRAGNIILAIDQIDRLSTAKESRIDLSEVLSAVLRDNTLPIIGITTTDDFNQFIRPNGVFLKLFEKIDVPEPQPEETTAILIGKALEFIEKEKISTTYDAILEIIEKVAKLLPDRAQPEKSIILLEDAVAEAKARKITSIETSLVDEILQQKTKIPLGAINLKEAEKLKNLEAILHQRIIGQDEAIVEIAKSLRRARAEIKTGSKPIGSFLFLGPTGVGKTETAKALAETYFGSQERMIRLDMSEFQEANALERLIGDVKNQRPGQLASLIRQNPFALLLVDEFEKTTKEVQNLFLQILDEGFFTDAFGKKVRMSNIIIIATSNAGAEFIREEVAKNPLGLAKKLIDYILQKGYFSPELINRFDGVVVYHPLSQNQAVAVADLMLKKLAQNLKDTKNINLEISPALAQLIAQKGFDVSFGARPMRRLIADRLEDGIAKMIIEGSVKNGDTIPAATLLKFLS